MTHLSLVSFDLQGTLTDADYSDLFWLKALPAAWSKRQGLDPKVGAVSLGEIFKKYGKFHPHYYDTEYWLSEAGVDEPLGTFLEGYGARVVPDERCVTLLERCKELGFVTVIISSTTRSFLDLECHHIPAVDASYSTLSDLGVAGKPPEVFSQVSDFWGFPPQECLHIGDNLDHDVKSPREAGWSAAHWPLDAFKLDGLLTGASRL